MNSGVANSHLRERFLPVYSLSPSIPLLATQTRSIENISQIGQSQASEGQQTSLAVDLIRLQTRLFEHIASWYR